MISNFASWESTRHVLEQNAQSLTPEQTQWCNQHIQGSWSLDEKGEVTVPNDLKIKPGDFEKFPVKFAPVKGHFYCNRCPNLTSLEGAPSTVGGGFSCSGCSSLTSLEGAPSTVGGSFYCNRCPKLTSLEGAPSTVGGHFYCSDCPNLTSLEGAPSTVGGGFYCHGCPKLLPELDQLRPILALDDDSFTYKKNPLFPLWLKHKGTMEEFLHKHRGTVHATKFGV